MLAPTGKDAAASRDLLAAAGARCFLCATLEEVCREARRGAGAALVTAEVILGDKERHLARLLEAQPPWSDFPLVVLTAPGAESPRMVKALEAAGNMTLMQRPVQVSELVSTIRAALRDRRRQYAVRGHLAEHRRQAEALKAAEERLRLMVESVEDYAIFSMEADGRVASWNAGAARVFGWAETEIVGQTAAVLFTPEDRAAGAAEGELARARETGRDEDERWHLRKDGSRFFASGVVTLIRDEGGALRGFTKVCRDVTERKWAEEALRDADRRKDEFLATLAHELRNPLAPIRNSLQVMRLAGGDRAAFEQSRAMMERQVGHMVRLVDDLLDVSRVSRGKVDLRKERLDLAAVLKAALETSRPALDAPGHELTVALPARPVHVEADATRLAQVIANLLNNAAKYTEPRGRIWLTAERQGGEAIVRIRDTGVGIPSEMLPRVFDLFTQVEPSLDRSRGGLGIGLTLVKSLVELHGGTVEAASPGRGRGSEFTVRLPALPDEGPRGARAAPNDNDAEGPSGRARAKPRRVLVVDDSRDAADSLAMVLRLLGHDARAIYDGQAALRAVEAACPDVVFLDLGMPGMSGYDVAGRLRAWPGLPPVRLVALTGWGAEEDHRRTKEAGFDHHFVKPVAPADLQTYLDGLDAEG